MSRTIGRFLTQTLCFLRGGVCRFCITCFIDDKLFIFPLLSVEVNHSLCIFAEGPPFGGAGDNQPVLFGSLQVKIDPLCAPCSLRHRERKQAAPCGGKILLRMGQARFSEESFASVAHAPCGFRLPLKVPPKKHLPALGAAISRALAGACPERSLRGHKGDQSHAGHSEQFN